jgi:predicted RNA-binding Zn-ribbon protein involved in translation (DUF1610 family)
MSVKTYQLYCDYCGYKRITDGSDVQDLREIKTSPVPGGVPQLDPLAKKTVVVALHQPAVESSGQIVPKPSSQRKKFKCPKCGRVIMARQIQKTEHIPNETDQFDGSETGSTGLSFP